MNEEEILILNDQGGAVMNVSYDVAATLRAEDHGHPPAVLIFDARGNGDGGVSPTITGDHQNRVTDYTALIVEKQHETKDDFVHRGGETGQTLDGSYYKGPGARNGKEREIVCEEPVYMSDRKGHNGVTDDGTATTLTAQEKERPAVASQIVRRLTPLECCRLQGYPDGWTEIGEPVPETVDWWRDTLDEDGNVIESVYMGRRTELVYYYTDEKGKRKRLPDSAQYKAYGNSIALPFWAWLARRIAAQYERPATMGSLFDGIGGFPLVFARAGIAPVWASEIEEFPIAVTKVRFPE